MDTADIAGARAPLSKADRHTLDTLFAHPIAHNLEWKDTLALFTRLGTVEQLHNNETKLHIGAEHETLRRPHGKDLTVDEIMALRHFLTRAGWSRKHPPEAAGTADFLVAIEHHEARIYHMDLSAADPADHVIRPADPHHYLHHLTHKDQIRQRGERAAEDPDFYERIAQAVVSDVPGSRIVIIGHGKGHSDAAHHLLDWMRLHHTQTAQRVAAAIAADLSALTAPQLLALARKTLAPPP